MEYIITAPNEDYERKIADVQFVKGKARTENEWLAQWFSGREGFSVEAVSQKQTKPKTKGGE